MAHIPPKFGMLLSRSWAAKLKGTLQMDLSYATIPIFRTHRKLYRENRLDYMINNRENHENHLIYVVHIDMGSSMLFNEVCPQKYEPRSINNKDNESNQQHAETRQDSEANGVSLVEELDEDWWHMDFDGVASKEGAGVGVWIGPPVGDPKFLPCKLHFKCTNIMV